MKILNVVQIRKSDAYTIEHEPIASLDLMERAAKTCFDWVNMNTDINKFYHVFCGMGNNGGYGLAIARMLKEEGRKVSVYIIKHSEKGSIDFDLNLERLQKCGIAARSIAAENEISNINPDAVIIDAMLGSGLNKPISGLIADVVAKLNSKKAQKISIDIPTGLFADDNRGNDLSKVFQADHTLTFQFPKFAFLIPSSGKKAGVFHLLDIGLHKDFIANESTNFHFTTEKDIAPLIKKRERFGHKGTYGHVQIIAGSHGKIGAAVLASKAALRSGCGLVTTHIPNCGYNILQSTIVEVMVTTDKEENLISEFLIQPKADAVGIGPGIGTNEKTEKALIDFLSKNKLPLVLDADALNILSKANQWSLVPENAILTPHPGEFARMAGKWSSDEEMHEKARDFAVKHKAVLILKGAYSAVCLPNSEVHFNSSGTPAMATAGSGDVLTGILTSLLALGYHPFDVAKIATFVHGKAGERASELRDEASVIAGDIIEEINFDFDK
jgi:NAD(P)H-hydrate epimerase